MILITYSAIILFLTRFKADAFEPCKTATEVDDITRSASRDLGESEKEKCDRIMNGWFRFKINSTDADMPTSCIDVFRCGSSKPIWLNGTVPQKENEVISLDACFRGFVGCCEKSKKIEVKNCGKYNVYHLKSVDSCNARYCVAERVPCPPGESSDTGYGPNCSPTRVTFSVIPEITPIDPKHDVDQAFRADHMLKFRCNITIPVTNKGHVFDLKWDLNGRTILPITKNIKEEDLSTIAVLTANDLKREKQETIGFKIKCSVRARAIPDSVPTPFIESEEFYAGMMVNTSTLTVNAGEPAYVQIRSTVPITCSSFKGRKTACDIRFEMLNYKGETKTISHEQFCKTKNRTKASRLCGVSFNAWDWNNFQILNITTKADQQIRDEYSAVVQLRSIGIDSDDLWFGYTLPDIEIKIRNKKFVPASCTSVTDPHITTFDGRYLTTFETGEYVLYKHLQKPVSVHVIHKSHGTSPRWNCAVAVQAGADTFIVYGCDRRWRHRRAFCDEKHGSNLDVYERNQGKDFEVHLPTGARVIIKVRGYSHRGIYDRYINVQIFASTLDENFTGGLCGMFNRNVNDDFTDPKSQLVTENQFKRSWHVDPANSLFVARARKEVLQRSQYFCSCYTSTIAGVLDNKADCNWKDSTQVCTAPTYAEQQCQYKHRREANDEMEIDIPEDIVIFKPAPPESNEWKNGWNETAAKNHCKTVLHNSQMYKKCKDIVHFNESQAIQMCVEDIKFLGTQTLSSQVDKPLREACINIVRLNTSLWSNNHSSTSTGISMISLMMSILENDCPGDCSVGGEKRGSCTRGICTCSPRYTGDDCSIDTQKPPSIEANDEDTVCDTSARGCSYVNFYGENFYDKGSGLKCRLEEQQVINKTNETLSKLHMTDAELVSFGEVRCQLPHGTKRRRREISITQPTGFFVSITSNGNMFSNKVPVVIFDSSCTECFNVNGSFTCTQKDNICIIDGKCFKLTSNVCASKEINNGFQDRHLWIIGAVLGGLTFICMVALFAVKFCLKPRMKTGSSFPSSSDQMSSFAPTKHVYKQ